MAIIYTVYLKLQRSGENNASLFLFILITYLFIISYNDTA